MGGKGSGRAKYAPKNKVENAMVHNLDLLAEFERFRDEVLPAIRKDLASGASAEDLYKKYQSLAAARGITIAMTEVDSGKALAAIRDIQDRAGGKATERKEVTHKHEKLSEDQLDALLMSKYEDAAEADEEGDDGKH